MLGQAQIRWKGHHPGLPKISDLVLAFQTSSPELRMRMKVRHEWEQAERQQPPPQAPCQLASELFIGLPLCTILLPQKGTTSMEAPSLLHLLAFLLLPPRTQRAEEKGTQGFPQHSAFSRTFSWPYWESHIFLPSSFKAQMDVSSSPRPS